MINAAQYKEGRFPKGWAAREHSMRESGWTSARFGRKNTELFYSLEGQTAEVNAPRLKPIQKGFSLRLSVYKEPFPASLQGYLYSSAGAHFLYGAMALTSDLDDGKGIAERLGGIWSEKWLI